MTTLTTPTLKPRSKTTETPEQIAEKCIKTPEQAPIHCKYFTPLYDGPKICLYQSTPTFKNVGEPGNRQLVQAYYCEKR